MHKSIDWKMDRIGSAIRGENPMILTRMKSGFAVVGDTQFLPGYCVLLPSLHVNSLEDLDYQQRSQFLLDMSLIGDAIKSVMDPIRINYSIYGNTDVFLHAHVFPRFEWEPEERKPKPVLLYPKEMWIEKQYQYCNEKHAHIRQKITQKLQEIIPNAYMETNA